MLIEMAQVVARRGTCSRLQVGTVVSRDGRIIATGYNGAPAGLPHCDHSNDKPITFELNDGEVDYQMVFKSKSSNIIALPQPMESGCTVAVHAEQNAIAFAAKHGLALDRSEMHVTHAPCAACARSIINAGIRKVSYQTPYRITDGVELLIAAGLKVIDLDAWA